MPSLSTPHASGNAARSAMLSVPPLHPHNVLYDVEDIVPSFLPLGSLVQKKTSAFSTKGETHHHISASPVKLIPSGEKRQQKNSLRMRYSPIELDDLLASAPALPDLFANNTDTDEDIFRRSDFRSQVLGAAPPALAVESPAKKVPSFPILAEALTPILIAQSLVTSAKKKTKGHRHSRSLSFGARRQRGTATAVV